MKKVVAVLTGGFSEEIIISTKSADNIYDAIKDHFETYIVFFEKSDWYVKLNEENISIDKNDFSFLLKGEKKKIDFVYNTIHGTPGEDGKAQGYFDMLDIPYSSSDHFTSALTFNKWACNEFLKQQGIVCADSICLRKGWAYDVNLIAEMLSFPCFVKPNEHGSSFGITKVNRIEELSPAIEKAFEGEGSVLIESFIDGVEVTCGAFVKDNALVALPLTEIVTENVFFDFEAKYKGESQEITPARISSEMTLKIQEITKSIYQIIGLSGIARMDYIIKDNIPYLIEANTTPGMSDASLIPQQIEAAGMSFSGVLIGVINDMFKKN